MKDYLIRFEIEDLKSELQLNGVAKGRHSEYINFFQKHLNDNKYYCVSPYNPIRSKIKCREVEPYTRNYVCGGISQYFKKAIVEINGITICAIVQKIDPKTIAEMYNMENYTTYYFSKQTIDSL